AAGPAPGQLPTTRPRRSRRPANGRTWLVLLQPDVFELDLHRLADMDLEPEEPLERTGLGVVVHEGAGDVAVQDFGNHVAAGDDVRLVPVIHLDDFQQLIAAALERADHLRASPLRDVGELAAHGEKAAAALLIDLSGESVLGVDVALVPFQDPVAGDGAAPLLSTRRQAHTPDLNAAVGGIDPVLDLQLEISRLAAAPDDEAVFLQRVVGRRLANDRAAFRTPELRITVPAFQRRAIED